MGLTYELRVDARLIAITGHDVVHTRDVLRLATTLETLVDDGHVAPGTHMLVDLRQAIPLHTYQDLIQLCVRFRPHHARWLARVALLAETDFTYTVARQYAALAERFDMAVAAFRTADEAHGWLALASTTTAAPGAATTP